MLHLVLILKTLNLWEAKYQLSYAAIASCGIMPIDSHSKAASDKWQRLPLFTAVRAELPPGGCAEAPKEWNFKHTAILFKGHFHKNCIGFNYENSNICKVNK